MDKKIVFITGAGKGIGKATALKYLREGFEVIATDRCLINKIENESIHYFEMDVTERDAIKQVVECVESQIGPIHTLVNIAGVFQSIAVDQITRLQWQSIFDVNTTGVFNVTQIVTEYMKKRRSGSVVVVSSNASKFPRKNMAAYASSKAAASMYTKCLALELAEYGIRCNIVSPGSTDTDMQKQLWNDKNEIPAAILEGELKSYRLGIPLKKIAKPEEIAETIFYLTSDLANHITMEEVTIDGGATMGV